MLTLYFKLSKWQKRELEERLKYSDYQGNLPEVKRLLSILSLAEGKSFAEIAVVLRITIEAVRGWFKNYLLKGIAGLRTQERPGRPNKLTKTQRRQLSDLIAGGLVKLGFLGACWRTR